VSFFQNFISIMTLTNQMCLDSPNNKVVIINYDWISKRMVMSSFIISFIIFLFRNMASIKQCFFQKLLIYMSDLMKTSVIIISLFHNDGFYYFKSIYFQEKQIFIDNLSVQCMFQWVSDNSIFLHSSHQFDIPNLSIRKKCKLIKICLIELNMKNSGVNQISSTMSDIFTNECFYYRFEGNYFVLLSLFNTIQPENGSYLNLKSKYNTPNNLIPVLLHFLENENQQKLMIITILEIHYPVNKNSELKFGTLQYQNTSSKSNVISKHVAISIFTFLIPKYWRLFYRALYELKRVADINLILSIPVIVIFFQFFTRFLSKKLLKSYKNCKRLRSTTQFSLFSKIVLKVIQSVVLCSFHVINGQKQVSIISKNSKNCLNIHLWFKNGSVHSNKAGCVNEHINQGRSYEQTNIDISSCFFSRSSQYSNYGGVIYISGSSYSMSVTNSMFYNCECSGYGGAIYFSSYDSVLRMICANSCSASAYHYALIQTYQNNRVEYLSVSYCSYTTSGYSSISLSSGIQSVDNTNCSMNNAYQISGIYVDVPYSFTSSHCTFSNNKVSDCICIYFWINSGTMLFSNIVNNNSPSQQGVVFVNGAYNMLYCIINDNQNTLFYIYGGSLEVSHSFIFHIATFSSGHVVSISCNNSFILIPTYHEQFFNSYYCHTDFPERSLEKNLINSPNQTPFPSQTATYGPTPFMTPIQTPFPSRTATYGPTPIRTPNQTPFPSRTATYGPTPYRTYDIRCSKNLNARIPIQSVFAMSIGISLLYL